MADSRQRTSARRRMALSRRFRLASSALSIVLVVAACGPLGPMAGSRLRGEMREGDVSSWSFAKDVETVQLETNPSDPHSVNTWIGVVNGRAYIPTSLILGPDDPSERSWVANVISDPQIRVRIEGVIYELKAVKVEDAAEREDVRAAMMAKYEATPDSHSESAWIFRLEPR